MRGKLWLGLLALALSSARAEASSTKAARRALEEALDEVKDAGGKCKRAVFDDLEEALEALEDADSRKRLAKVMKNLKGIKEDADDCPKAVIKAIRASLEEIAELSSDDDDDDDDGAPKKRKKKAECWRDGDPGCDHTKNGAPPMGKAAYQALYNSVKGQSPNIFPMLDTLRAGMGNQYMTSLQMKEILPLFKPHVFPMLDAVKAIAPRLVDPQNGADVSVIFQPHVFPAQDAVRVVAEQRGD